MASALKRGKNHDYETERSARPKKSNTEVEAGAELHDYLVDQFIAGELNNKQVATISHLHQRNGGSGLESLAAPSSSNSSHQVVKNYIAETYGSPDTLNVQTPIFNRQSCLRDSISIPVHLPTTFSSGPYN